MDLFLTQNLFLLLISMKTYKKLVKGQVLYSYLSIKTFDQIYKIYVRPHLDFCDVIFYTPLMKSILIFTLIS